jgi:hypothetical protein
METIMETPRANGELRGNDGEIAAGIVYIPASPM